MKKERLFYLDFVRAFAVIFILIHHFNTSLSELEIKTDNLFFPHIGYTDMGRFGVSLFFIISGASLMLTYAKDFHLKQYFTKRFFAIFPMYWLAYLCGFLFLFYTRGKMKGGVPTWKFVFTLFGMDGYLNNATSTFYILGEWFLGCIILFYVLFPILRYTVLKFPILTLCCVSCIYIFLILFRPTDFPIYLERDLLSRMLEIVIGMIFIQYIKKVEWWQALILGGVFIGTLFCNPTNQSTLMVLIMATGVSLFGVLVYIGQVIRYERIKAACSYISKYSYAIFLVHHVVERDLIMKRFTGETLNKVETCMLLLLCLIAVAVVSKSVFVLHKMIMARVHPPREGADR